MLSAFILNNDKKLKMVTLTRNLISDLGGDILLEAITETIRMTKFVVAYGN
jgi:hypothetical protein